MSETAPLRAVATGTDALIAIVAEAIGEIRAAREDIARARAEGDGGMWSAILDARLADLTGDLRQGAKRALIGDVLDRAAPPALEAVPDQPRHSHRRPRRYRLPRQRVPGDDQPGLWSVEGIAAAPAVVKLAVVAAAVMVAGVSAGAGVLAHSVLGHPSAGASVSSSPAGSAPGWGTPVVPAPSSSLIALTRAHPDVKAARTAGPPGADPVPSPQPPPSPAAAPSSAPPSQAPVQGQLQVSAEELDLGTATSVTVTLTARLGPVSWSASTASADLSLDSYGGTLQAGESVTVTVTLNLLDSLTSGTVDFSAGADALPVRVTWTPAAPVSALASPPPSPS